MKNKIWLFLVAVLVLSAISVSAVPNGCVSTALWNDSILGPQNVSAGHVCIDVTDYDVPPTAVIYCDNDWANYIDGACTYASHYVGYKGDGTDDCDATDWLIKTAVVQIAQGYIINMTVNAEISGSYVTNTGEVVPAKDACLNAYTLMGPTGYCSGGTTLDTNGSLANATDGNVCIVGVDSQPDASVHCIGTADTWSDCVENQCTIDEYYVGYSVGNATGCSDTDWVVMGVSNPANGYRVSNTGHANLCTYVATGGTPVYTGCANAYTRNGTSGYCNGAGGDATTTLHVTVGKVCVAGANAAPNSTLNCGVWYDCVVDATLANTYYAGYAASGTACSDTSWVASGSHVDFASGKRSLITGHSATLCGLGGYGYSYTKSDLQPIIVDAMGTVGASFVDVAELVVIAFVLLFGVGVFVRIKGLI